MTLFLEGRARLEALMGAPITIGVLVDGLIEEDDTASGADRCPCCEDALVDGLCLRTFCRTRDEAGYEGWRSCPR